MRSTVARFVRRCSPLMVSVPAWRERADCWGPPRCARANPMLFPLVAIGFLVLVVVLGRLNSGKFVLRWRMARIPEVAIASARANQRAKIGGQVRTAGTLLEGPLSGVRCACYRLVIVDRGSENGGVMVDESESVPFLLLDSTGTMRVDPVLFTIVPGRRSTHSQRLPTPGMARTLEAYLERGEAQGRNHGVLSMLRDGWPMQVEEHAIREGDLVWALGDVSYRTDAGASSSTEIVLTCPDDTPLVLQVRA